jgi:hypothetical protein
MKSSPRKHRDREADDSLFGLLSAYKSVNTYFRVFSNQEKKLILLQMTDNPRHFLLPSDALLSGFKLLRRSEIGAIKLSAKYLSPLHIIEHFGETLGIKIPQRGGKITNNLKNEKILYQLETSLAQKPALIAIVRKILLLSPQKKYEIIEKFLSSAMKTEIEE